MFWQIVSAKFQSTAWVSLHPAFMGNCPIISLMCYPYLSSRWVHLFASGVTKGNEDHGLIQNFVLFYFWCWLRNEVVRLSSGFYCVNVGMESLSSDLPELGWYQLVCVEYLKMIKTSGGWFLFQWELMLL